MMKPITRLVNVTGILSILALSPAAWPQTPNLSPDVQQALNQWVLDQIAGTGSLRGAYEEGVRLWQLFGEDVQMWMNVETETQADGFRLGQYFFFGGEIGSESSMYAKFDWQNMATAMLVTSGESSTGFGYTQGAAQVGPNLGGFMFDSEEQSVLMFFDNEGFIYTPYEDELGRGGFIKTDTVAFMQDMMQALDVGLDLAIESGITEMVDRLLASLGMLANAGADDWIFDYIPQEVLSEAMLGYFREQGIGFGGNTEPDDTAMSNLDLTEDRLRELIREFETAQFDRIRAIPPIIHFAWIISPASMRARFALDERTITCSYHDFDADFASENGIRMSRNANNRRRRPWIPGSLRPLRPVGLLAGYQRGHHDLRLWAGYYGESSACDPLRRYHTFLSLIEVRAKVKDNLVIAFTGCLSLSR